MQRPGQVCNSIAVSKTARVLFTLTGSGWFPGHPGHQGLGGTGRRDGAGKAIRAARKVSEGFALPGQMALLEGKRTSFSTRCVTRIKPNEHTPIKLISPSTELTSRAERASHVQHSKAASPDDKKWGFYCTSRNVRARSASRPRPRPRPTTRKVVVCTRCCCWRQQGDGGGRHRLSLCRLPVWNTEHFPRHYSAWCGTHIRSLGPPPPPRGTSLGTRVDSTAHRCMATARVTGAGVHHPAWRV